MNKRILLFCFAFVLFLSAIGTANAFYDPDEGRFLTADDYLGEPGTPPSLNRYLYAYGNPTAYIDPDGRDVEIIIGRPYMKPSGEWSPYGHVAVRVFDGTGNNKYDNAYDYGRYGKSWGLGNSKGEGILNIQNGREYIKREAAERDSVSYVIKTDSATDKEIMTHYNKKAAAGTPRKDMERRLSYKNNKTYQLKDDYDAAPLTGIGRHTCVTNSAEGLKAANDKNVNGAVAALDELYPEKVEKNMEKLFDKDVSTIQERRTYAKGKPDKPVKITHEDHDRAIDDDPAVVKREDEMRNKAWKKPE